MDGGLSRQREEHRQPWRPEKLFNLGGTYEIFGCAKPGPGKGKAHSAGAKW